MQPTAGTFADALTALAGRYAARQDRLPTYQEKLAQGQDFLSSLGEHIQKNPEIAGALLGGAGGAGLGGLSTVFGNRRREREDRRSPWQAALTGGLAGAALGGGIGLGSRAFGSVGKEMPGTKPVGFMEDGKVRMIDPSKLERGALGTEETRLSKNRFQPLSPKSWLDYVAGPRIAGALSSATFGALPSSEPFIPGLPYSSYWAPKIGLLDALRTPFKYIPDAGYRFGFGQMRPEHAIKPEVFGKHPVETVLGKDHPLANILGKGVRPKQHPWPGMSPVTVPPEGSPVPHKLEPKTVAEALSETTRRGVAAPAGKTIWQRFVSRLSGTTRPGSETVLQAQLPAGAEPNTLSREEAQNIAKRHWAEELKALSGDKGAPAGKIWKPLVGEPRAYRPPTWRQALGGRLAAYGALPAIELFLNWTGSQAANQTGQRLPSSAVTFNPGR
jgi:hypothetical protein